MENEEINRAKTKAEAYGLMSLEICKEEQQLIGVMYHKTRVIHKHHPVMCFAEGFKQGLAFVLQGVAEGKINMQIVEPEPTEPKCKVCWKPQSECDGGLKDMTE